MHVCHRPRLLRVPLSTKQFIPRNSIPAGTMPEQWQSFGDTIENKQRKTMGQRNTCPLAVISYTFVAFRDTQWTWLTLHKRGACGVFVATFPALHNLPRALISNRADDWWNRWLKWWIMGVFLCSVCHSRARTRGDLAIECDEIDVLRQTFDWVVGLLRNSSIVFFRSECISFPIQA